MDRRLPEDVELQRKRKELEEKKVLLAEKELELATLRAERRGFEHRYMQQVGALYAQVDSLEAALAGLRARRNPGIPEYTASAREASARAQESAREAGSAEGAGDSQTVDFEPSADLKSLYRELAKRVHPDLCFDSEEKERRTSIMAQINTAYAAGDELGLRRILDEWRARPESIEGKGPGAELVRVIRRIAQVERRLEEILEATRSLEASDLYQLWRHALEAKGQGRDLLAEMAAHLQRQMDTLRADLEREREGVSRAQCREV